MFSKLTYRISCECLYNISWAKYFTLQLAAISRLSSTQKTISHGRVVILYFINNFSNEVTYFSRIQYSTLNVASGVSISEVRPDARMELLMELKSITLQLLTIWYVNGLLRELATFYIQHTNHYTNKATHKRYYVP
jgi:hypothetical protein